MAIIWPFSSSIEEYVKRGKDIDVPRPDCPKCSVPMVFWSSYKRYVRHLGKDLTICIKRARCKGCKVTDSLLPSFLLLNRLDCVETIGTAVEAVFGEGSTIMAAGLGAGVPYAPSYMSHALESDFLTKCQHRLDIQTCRGHQHIGQARLPECSSRRRVRNRCSNNELP